MALTDEERKQARTQQAIADAYDEWVAELEKNPPAPTMTPTGRSEYPQYAYLVDATPAQQIKLTKAVNDAVANASAD